MVGSHNADTSSTRPGRVVAVASGKGGVGKTTISVNLALALSESGQRVGLLDADLYGPDVPLMFGMTRAVPAEGIDLWRAPQHRRRWAPVEVLGVKVFSTQFLIGEDQAVATHATFASMLLRRMFADVDWGDLDVLVLDLPPGTTDVQQQIAASGIDAALVVVTPQDVAHLDARKLVATFRRQGITVIGGVENMTDPTCPSCHTRIEFVPPAPSHRTIWSHGIDKLASIPFTPQPAHVPLLRAHPDHETSEEFRSLADRVLTRLGDL